MGPSLSIGRSALQPVRHCWLAPVTATRAGGAPSWGEICVIQHVEVETAEAVGPSRSCGGVSWCATLSPTYLSEFFGVDGENITIHVYAPMDFLVFLCFRATLFF